MCGIYLHNLRKYVQNLHLLVVSHYISQHYDFFALTTLFLPHSYTLFVPKAWQVY